MTYQISSNLFLTDEGLPAGFVGPRLREDKAEGSPEFYRGCDTIRFPDEGGQFRCSVLVEIVAGMTPYKFDNIREPSAEQIPLIREFSAQGCLPRDAGSLGLGNLEFF